MKAHFLVNGKLVLKETTTTIGALPYHGFGPPPTDEEQKLVNDKIGKTLRTKERLDFFIVAEKVAKKTRGKWIVKKKVVAK